MRPGPPATGVSSLFVPVARMPAMLRVIAHALPTTRAVAPMQGVSAGVGWGTMWVLARAACLWAD